MKRRLMSHPTALAPRGPSLGYLHEERGDCQSAPAFYERALKIWQESLGADHPDLAYALLGLGNCRIANSRLQSAVAPLERAFAVQTKAEVDANFIADVRFSLSRALFRPGGDRKRALAPATKALAQYRRSQADTAKHASKTKAVEAWLASRAR